MKQPSKKQLLRKQFLLTLPAAIGIAIFLSACGNLTDRSEDEEASDRSARRRNRDKTKIEENIDQETAEDDLFANSEGTVPEDGNSEDGNPDSDPEGGDPENSNSESGDPADIVPENEPEPEEPAPEKPVPENPAIEEPVFEEPAPEDPAENAENLREPTAEISEAIPSKYLRVQPKESGTIRLISYRTKDYFGDLGIITKQAYVYLPYGYSNEKQYNVLYLLHGIGGDENEWGMNNNFSKVKLMMDNLIYYGDIEPFIVVTPNGRSSRNFSEKDADVDSFYVFGSELRNDLIPYMDRHFSTYAEYNENGYDLAAAREHRAIAGLSMGGMQTINIGIGMCADMFGYYGAFSAAPSSYNADSIAYILYDCPYEIRYFYNICGKEDGIAYESASAAAKDLPEKCDRFIPGENFMWQELEGGHDFRIWYLGFYNFAQIAFSK